MGQTMSNLGNANVVDPRQAKWGDLDSNEKFSRVFAGGMRGLGQGISNLQQNPAMSGGGPMIQNTPVNPVDPSYFQPQKRGLNNLSFYGGS